MLYSMYFSGGCVNADDMVAEQLHSKKSKLVTFPFFMATNNNDWWSQFFSGNNNGLSNYDYSNFDSDNDECYNILAIHKSAKQNEIKKAYRKKLRPLMNDRDKTEECAYINSAYQILSNNKTKKLYDKGGLINVKKSNYDFHCSLPSMKFTYKKINISITLNEAYHGISNKKIKLYDKKLYKNDYIIKNDIVICHGYIHMHKFTNKLYIPNDIILTIFNFLHDITYKCAYCDGKGKGETTNQQYGSMNVQQQKACKYCNGTGDKDGLSRTIPITETVNITKGCNKYKIRYLNKIFKIKIGLKKHKIFRVNDFQILENLTMDLNINLKQAFLGFNSDLIKIRHLNGKILILNTLCDDIVIQNNSFVILKGYGMPIIGSDDMDIKYGNLRVIFNVRLPENRKEAMDFVKKCDFSDMNGNSEGDRIIVEYFDVKDKGKTYNLYKGYTAQINGLEKSANLNGKTVSLIQYYEDTDRWRVKLLNETPSKYLSIKND
eukprot:418846_1